MSWRIWSIVPVWLVALVGAVLVGVYAGADALDWLAVVLAGAVLLGFVIQLAIQRKEGLVLRLIAGVGGAVIVLAIATGVLVAVHPGSLLS